MQLYICIYLPIIRSAGRHIAQNHSLARARFLERSVCNNSKCSMPSRACNFLRSLHLCDPYLTIAPRVTITFANNVFLERREQTNKYAWECFRYDLGWF